MSCSKFGVLVGLGAGSLLGCASALTEDASKRLLSDATIAAADGRMDEATDLQLRCLEWCAEPYGSKAASLLRQMPRPDERHLATVWAVVARLEERALEDELDEQELLSRLFVLVAVYKGWDAKERPLALLHRADAGPAERRDQILAELASSMPRALTILSDRDAGFLVQRVASMPGEDRKLQETSGDPVTGPILEEVRLATAAAYAEALVVAGRVDAAARVVELATKGIPTDGCRRIVERLDRVTQPDVHRVACSVCRDVDACSVPSHRVGDPVE